METTTEIDLDKAEAFRYRAEGNANLVLSLPTQWLVLRLRKSSDRSTIEAKDAADADRITLHRSVDYSHGVSNLLGSGEYTFAAKIVRIKCNDNAAFNRRLEPDRPKFRLTKGVFCQFGILYPDVAFPPVALQTRPHCDTFSVEIKPKQGWHASDNEKCRYCLLQYLKLSKGTIECLSKFCPLDLFSGVGHRMHAAINALVRAPQNNFRVFRNGKLLYGQGYSFASLVAIFAQIFPTESNSSNSFSDLLIAILLREYEQTPAANLPNDVVVDKTNANACDDNTEATCLETIPNRLPVNCVLARIRNLQLLIKSVIDGMDRSEDNEMALRAPNLNITSGTVSVSELNSAEQYSVGATALDCSLMLTFYRLDDGQQSLVTDYQRQHVVSVGGQLFMTKATIMDLDAKSTQQHYTKYKQQIHESRMAYKNYIKTL